MGVDVGVNLKGDESPELVDASEEIKFRYPSVKLNVNNEDIGVGTVFVGTCRLYWVSATEPKTLNMAVDYPTVVLHALSQDPQSWPAPCLYCHFDTSFDLASTLISRPVTASNACFSSEDDEDDSPLTEVRFIPSDAENLEALFKTVSDMAALHPDTAEPQLDTEWFTADNQVVWNPDSRHDDLSGDERNNGIAS